MQFAGGDGDGLGGVDVTERLEWLSLLRPGERHLIEVAHIEPAVMVETTGQEADKPRRSLTRRPPQRFNKITGGASFSTIYGDR
jgi:hypothetical protein